MKAAFVIVGGFILAVFLGTSRDVTAPHAVSRDAAASATGFDDYVRRCRDKRAALGKVATIPECIAAER